MDYNLTDQQQAELIKNWLTKNAKFLSAVLILGLSGFFGGQYFRESNQKQAEMASKLFSELEYSVKLKRASQAQSLLQQIDNDFANTPYQDQGHLLMSKLFIDATEYDNAIIQLEFLLDNSEEESLQHISRLRIARIKLQQNFLDEALTTLQTESMGTFEAKYEEIKGDIYSEKGDLLQARESYHRALELMLPGNFDYDFIQIKLKDIQDKENLGSVDTEEDTA